MQKLELRPQSFSRDQNERFHLILMTARRLNRIVDSEWSCASDADDVAIHSWLGNQKLKCSIQITSAFRLVRTATSLAVSSHIDGQCVDSSSRQLSRHVIPRST